jgi:hypothetical protein
MNDVIYVDEIISETDEEGNCEFSFQPADWADGENKVYVVRVGGQNIDVADSMIIAFYDGKVYTAGDVNADGNVDKIDAALVLKYLSSGYFLNGQQLTAADVNGNKSVDMSDVIKILQNE